ncbi:MAG: heavy metal translocating P-type ATPase [Chromatiaceae bacterium]|nr:MAG: heavy metal translocating P-type ATPase [Chromatiaceae bacterium]
MAPSAPNAPMTATGATRCFHCGLPVGDDGVATEVAGHRCSFCCGGCRAVCEAIHAAGLEGFYRRTPEGEVLGPPPTPPRQLALYDLEEVQQEFVQNRGETREVNLLVEGIHCAACVWLIETGLAALPGVTEARVNLTGRRLRLTWDQRRQRLSAILQRLADLGYAAVPFDPDRAEGTLQRDNRALLYRMAFAGFAMMNLMWVSIALYAGADRGEFRSLFHWIGLAIATPTLLYSGYPFYRGALTGLRRLRLTMDLPIAIGASITWLYSFYVTLGGPGEVYWDTVVNFMFVILVGRYLEALSRRQAVAATQRLLDLQPRVATVLRPSPTGGSPEEATVPIRAVRPGDLVLVRPGETIPVDGEIVAGESSLDESMLTGESRPAPRCAGESVAAGTLNGAGVLQVRVTGLLRDTALGRIIRLVEEAQSSKAPIQSTADRIVPWFVAATLGLALLSFMLWVHSDLETALLAATAVLIITCPCALGMATPMAITVATGLGARHGILIKHGAVLETLSRIDHFVFDKTGTLTSGRPGVVALRHRDGTWQAGRDAPAELPAAARAALGQAAALEILSEHPLAHAIVTLARAASVPIADRQVQQVRVVPGAGIGGEVDGQQVLIGTADWLADQGVDLSSPLSALSAAATMPDLTAPVYCAIDGRLALQLAIADPLRPDAAALIQQLLASGLRVTLLTGDRRAVATRIAAELLGTAPDADGHLQVIAEVRPEDKDRVIAELQRDGQRVAMVGDGINDAPALVRADVGIAVGSGTDVSIASADIVLMQSELRRVADAAVLAQRTLRTIRQNIALSFAYNAIMVPLAMAALVTPLVAAISMPLSSLAVIGNSARIHRLFAIPRAAATQPRPDAGHACITTPLPAGAMTRPQESTQEPAPWKSSTA